MSLGGKKGEITQAHRIGGRVSDEEGLEYWEKMFGLRCVKARVEGDDVAMCVGRKEGKPVLGVPEAFAAMVRIEVPGEVWVAVAYPFYDREEAVRTLRLLGRAMRG